MSETKMRYSKSYEQLDDDYMPDEQPVDETLDIDELEADTGSKAQRRRNARKSVEDYLERKRAKRQYKDLFDDEYDFDE
tara:strand:- start:493 stop:729 length:237 start_codon:yes stop_codon:yes gene_type:complete